MNKPEPLSDEQIAVIMTRLNEALTGFKGWSWMDVARAVEAERDAAWAARLEALQAEDSNEQA